MNFSADMEPKNCNHCIFRSDRNRHWDIEDYCKINKMRTGSIDIDADCPLKKAEDNMYVKTE